MLVQIYSMKDFPDSSSFFFFDDAILLTRSGSLCLAGLLEIRVFFRFRKLRRGWEMSMK